MNILDSFRILPRAFGLDISDGGMKFVYLQKHQDEYLVAAFGESNFEQGIIEKGKVISPSKLAEALRQAVGKQRRHDGLPAYAVIGFPEEDVFIRVVQMPKMDEEELTQAIRWEIEGNIPLSIDNVFYAYQAIKPSSSTLGHIDVLVAAASKTIIDGYTEAFALAGIQPLVVEPASAALVRAVVPSSNITDDIILLDMGAMHTRIAIYAQGALRLTSSIPISLENFIVSIMRTFSYDHSEAERALCASGLSPNAREGKLFETIAPIVVDMKEQIEKYMTFHKSHREHEHGEIADSSSLIIAGGGALIPGMSEYFSEVFHMTVHLADPWVNLPIHRKGEIPHIPYRDALRFAPAIGLALRGSTPPRSLDDNSFFAV